MAIRAIGFDYGGVIEGDLGSSFNEKACAFLGIDVEVLKKSYFKFNALANEGKINWDACWKLVLADLGKEDHISDFLTAYKTWNSKVVHPEMVSLLDRLRAANYKIGILSNNTTERAEEIRAKGIADHVDVLMISADVGLSKPDAAIFNLFFSKLGVHPREALFVDDSMSAVARAEEVGFMPIFFTGYEALVSTLKELGINV